MDYAKRWAAGILAQALSFQRTAVIIGARQCGKTTMVQNEMPVPSRYVTLDDAGSYQMAKEDPAFFVKMDRQKCLVIDEIQKAPELIGQIKMQVDLDNRPAQYVMTGSSDYRKLPHSADSLAGRSVFIRLRSMTEAEAMGKQPRFLEKTFEREFPSLSELDTCSKPDLFELAIKGGFPQARKLTADIRWQYFQSYVQAQIRHDLAEDWNLWRFGALDTLLQYMGAYSSKLLNIQEIGKRLAISRQTTSNYINALEAMYLVDKLPAWLHIDYDIGSKVPKILMTDSGLMAYLLNVKSPEYLITNREASANIGGKLAETWIYNQLAAEVDLHPGWRISHFRYRNRQEIDFMVEKDGRNLLGIEVKSAESINADDLKSLRWFANQSKHPFTGLVIYAGNQVLSFGGGIYAVPYAALWA